MATVPVSGRGGTGRQLRGRGIYVGNKPGPGIPEYVPVGFVAKRCGVSNTTVLRWIGTGELAAFRLPGGHYRIDNREFSRFTRKYRMTVNTPPTDGKTRSREKNNHKCE